MKWYRVLFTLLVLGLLLSCTLPLIAQEESLVPADYESLLAQISAIGDATSADEAAALLDPLWDALLENDRVPFVYDDHVVFLYRGEERSVVWAGDFLGWELDTALQGERVGESDLWIAETQLPLIARIEYKIVLNGSQWILDPANPHLVGSGFGPNNEVRMPLYVVTDLSERREDVAEGDVTDPVILSSASMGYDIGYWVYTPAGYESLEDLPVIYVTDGNDFMNEDMGRMVPVLDNMIADGRIEPVIAVLIDARQPGAPSNNRREDEFLENPDYAAFVADELVQVIDETYNTNASPEGRVIMGTSYGGVAAAYIAVLYPAVFDSAALFSPAFWASEQLTDLYFSGGELPERMFIGTGYPGWDVYIDAATINSAIAAGIDITFLQTVEGHSWGTWRAMIDDMLVCFFGIRMTE